MTKHEDSQRGSVAIMTAILLVVIIGFAALVVDLGLIFRVRNELQNASDSGALAGAELIDGTPNGITAARTAVQHYAQEHLANNSAVSVSDSDIIFGHWHLQDPSLCDGISPAAPCFQSLGTNPSDTAAVNAVQVTSRRGQSTFNPVALFFAGLLGRSQTDVMAKAVGLAGGPARETCGFPMAVPDCALANAIGTDGTCDYCMQYQDNNTDNAGWTSFDTGAASGPVINSLVKGACYVNGEVAVDPVTGQCQGSCPERNLTAIEDEVKVQNGNLLNTGSNSFCETIKDILRRGVPGGPVQPFTVQVPVLQSTSGTCDATQFSGLKQIAGYATMVIYGASCGNGDPNPAFFPTAPPCYKDAPWPPPSDKYIVAQLQCGLKVAEPSGGGDFGLHALMVRLVQ